MTKKYALPVLATLAVAAFAVPALAQAPVEGAPTKGYKSIDINGQISSIDDSKNTSGTVDGSLGYLVTNQLEVGPRFTVNISHSNSGTGSSGVVGDGFVGAFGRYNFTPLGTGTVPYVRAELGTGFGPGLSNITIYSGALGARFFTKPQQALFVELEEAGLSSSDFGGKKNQTNVNFGLTFFVP